MTPRVVLVTGVAGFIGGHVAEALAHQGDSVIGIDSSPPGSVVGRPLVRYHAMHLPDPSLPAMIREIRPSVVVHCAGRASVQRSIEDPEDDFLMNTAMTCSVLEALRAAAPDCHFIFPSSAAVYGDPVALPIVEGALPAPISPYGFHKLQAEQLCREYSELHGMTTTNLRIFSAYGPRLRRQVVWDICRKALTEPAVHLQGTGLESRDFIHVRDIAAAISVVASSDRTPRHNTYNLASGRETSISDLAALVLSTLGLEVNVVFDAVDTPGMPGNWRADISRLQAEGFGPQVSLEDGIDDVCRWARSEIR